MAFLRNNGVGVVSGFGRIFVLVLIGVPLPGGAAFGLGQPPQPEVEVAR
jgi:hypothetical protein